MQFNQLIAGAESRKRQRWISATADHQMHVRRKMIEQELYELPVLSYQELTQEINIQPLARVEL